MYFADTNVSVCMYACVCVFERGGFCYRTRARARNQPNQHEAPRDTAILPTCREKIKTRSGRCRAKWIGTALAAYANVVYAPKTALLYIEFVFKLKMSTYSNVSVLERSLCY